MATIYKSKYRDLIITDDDLLWAGRGCMGEGLKGLTKDQQQEKIASMLWALINRCLLHPYFSKHKYSYGKMWIRFSQPINPAWTRDGKFCRPGGRYHGSKYCTEPKLKRRDIMRSKNWSDFSPLLTESLQKAQDGILFPPDQWATDTQKGRISNWSAITERRGGLPIANRYPWGVQIGGEWFFEDKALLPGDVSIEIDPSVLSKYMYKTKNSYSKDFKP